MDFINEFFRVVISLFISVSVVKLFIFIFFKIVKLIEDKETARKTVSHLKHYLDKPHVFMTYEQVLPYFSILSEQMLLGFYARGRYEDDTYVEWLSKVITKQNEDLVDNMEVLVIKERDEYDLKNTEVYLIFSVKDLNKIKKYLKKMMEAEENNERNKLEVEGLKILSAMTEKAALEIKSDIAAKEHEVNELIEKVKKQNNLE